jgi:hypothetical protein
MAEVISGTGLTTIVLNSDETKYLRDVLLEVETRALGDDFRAHTQIAVLGDLFMAISDDSPEEEDDLLTAAGESYHFTEPDLAEPEGK